MASEQNTRRPARPRQVKVIAAAAVFVVGFLVGQVLRLNHVAHPDSLPPSLDPNAASDVQTELDSDPTKTSSATRDTPPIDAADAISRADLLLRDGQAKDAATIYNELLAANPTESEPRLLYRLALCWEELGDLEQAWSAYQSLAGEDRERGFSNAVQFAQARVALRMGKTESARWLLSRFSLNASAEGAEDPLSADVAHVLAHLYATEALRELPLDLMEERALVRSQLPWSAAHALDLIHEDMAEETAAETQQGPVISIVDRFGGRPEQLRVNARLSGIHAFDAVVQLATLAGLEVRWTSAAQQFARRHPARADVQGISVARFLDLLLDQLSLYWIEDGGAIEIRSAGEISHEKLLGVQTEQASRTLRYAVSMYPDSRFAPYSYLDLGSVAFAMGDLQDSVTFFMELVRQRPSPSVRRIAWFNVGKSYRLLDEPMQTENAFLHVVDDSLGHAIEPLGYLYLGRHHLEQDNPLVAAKFLVRTVSLAKNSETRAQGSLALAAAYLMAGNDAAANLTIMEHRDTLQAGALKEAAVFVSALARTRASLDEASTWTHGRQLATSISRVSPADFGGATGHLLIGEAYEILGLRHQMAIVFERGIGSGTGPLRDRMRFELANYYIEQDALDTARQHLEALLLKGTKGWDRRAKLQIAKMALLQRDHRTCHEHCLELLESSTSEEEQSAILRLLGSSFQSQEDHYNAAVCFAGMLPRGLSSSVARDVLE